MASENNVPLKTTDTDMMISILANSEKLKPKNELYHFEDEQQNDENEKIESCMDDDVRSENEHEYNNHNEHKYRKYK